MSTSTILKINILGLALGFTIYTIYNLQTKGLSPSVRAMFGLEPSAEMVAQAKAKDDFIKAMSFRLNWCDTRVVSLIKPNEFKLTQEASNWVLETTTKRVVDFLAVEKWLSRFCKVQASPVEKHSEEGFSPALMVKFVNGTVEVLRRNSSGVLIWKGQAYTSPILEGALGELAQLPDGKRK